MKKVYVLVIEHRHGEDLYVCRTTRGARKRLDAYVREWWDYEMGSFSMPATESERIEEYFLEMSEQRGREFYRIDTQDLLD